MAEPVKPVLKKPPGYRDPTAPVHLAPKPPVRRPVLPPSFYPKKKRKSCCRLFCCFFCIFIFVLVLVVVIAAGLFYLWFEPKLPVFHLQSLQITRFNVSVISDATYLDSQTVVRLEARNPNGKITLYYGSSRVRMSVGGEDDTELGSASVVGFTQAKKNTTVLKFTTQVKNVLIDDGVGKKLKARFRSKELVVFAEVRTKVGLGVERWKIGTVGMNVLCGRVSLKKLRGGAMPKCTINLLKWINIH